MATVRIPAVLSDTGSSKRVEMDGEDVIGILRAYAEGEPEFEENVLTDDGEGVKEYINVYVNGKDIRNIRGADTPVDPDDEIRVIPAASGGQ